MKADRDAFLVASDTLHDRKTWKGAAAKLIGGVGAELVASTQKNQDIQISHQWVVGMNASTLDTFSFKHKLFLSVVSIEFVRTNQDFF